LPAMVTPGFSGVHANDRRFTCVRLGKAQLILTTPDIGAMR